MKSIYFHIQPYRDLPDDFRERYESIWVTPPNDELCDSEQVHEYLNDNLAELELADDLGFDGVGTNEHHSNGYGFPAAPQLTMAILARRRSTAALCMLGATLPTQVPMRAIEEMGIIDCMSGGRLIAGLPVGTPMDTVGLASLPPAEVRPRWFEAHDLMMQAWSRSGPFPYNGKFNKLRYVNPWPKPLQRPHPPIWLAGGNSSETKHFAAQNDYTYNYLSFSGAKVAEAQLDAYWELLDSYGIDRNPYRCGFAQIVLVADTDEEAERVYWPHVKAFYDKSMYVPGWQGMIPGYMTQASFEATIKKMGTANIWADRTAPDWKTVIERRMVVAGSPESVAQQLEDIAKRLNLGHMLAIMQVQSMPTELARHNATLYAQKVLPRVQQIWSNSGYEDRWWPTGASQGPRSACASEEATA